MELVAGLFVIFVILCFVMYTIINMGLSAIFNPRKAVLILLLLFCAIYTTIVLSEL